MRHLKAINRKAAHRGDADARRRRAAAGWAAASPPAAHSARLLVRVLAGLGGRISSGGTAGLCQPVERDLFDCHITCFWPAHVPDHYNHAPDWTAKCASAQKDWRKIDLIFPDKK